MSIETYRHLLELNELSSEAELRSRARRAEEAPSTVCRLASRHAGRLADRREYERRLRARARRMAHANRVRAMLEAEDTLYVIHSFVDVDGGGADRLLTFDSHDEYFEWRREQLHEPALKMSITVVDRQTAEEFQPFHVDHALRAHEDGHPHVLYL